MSAIFHSPTWQRLRWPLAALAILIAFQVFDRLYSLPVNRWSEFFQDGFFRLEVKDGRLYGSLVDILNRAAPVMLLALGMTLVIATGGVDLSVGAVMAITGAAAALLLTKANMAVAPV